MMNKISAQTIVNYDLLLRLDDKLAGMETKTITVIEDQNTTLKLMCGCLIVIAGLLAVIAWS